MGVILDSIKLLHCFVLSSTIILLGFFSLIYSAYKYCLIYCKDRTSLSLFLFIYKRIASSRYLSVFCPLSKLTALFWWSWLSRLSKLLSTGLKSELCFFSVEVLGTYGCNTSKMTFAAVTKILTLLYRITACLKDSLLEHSGCSLLCEWPFTNTT